MADDQRTRVRVALEKDVELARKFLNNLERYLHYGDDDSEEEQGFAEMQVNDALLRLELRLCAEFESRGMRAVAERLVADMKTFDDKSGFEMLPVVGELWNPAFGALQEYFEVLATYLPEVDEEPLIRRDRERLRLLLAGTAKLIETRGIVPKAEKDVETAVYDIVCLMFPDAQRQISIPGNFKIYKPDIGVPSLGTAIEYKFAADEAELKYDLDGIFTDIHGYANDKTFNHFIAVLYTTGSFLTDAQLKSLLEKADVPNNWDFIMITGTGARQKQRGKSGVRSGANDATGGTSNL